MDSIVCLFLRFKGYCNCCLSKELLRDRDYQMEIGRNTFREYIFLICFILVYKNVNRLISIERDRSIERVRSLNNINIVILYGRQFLQQDVINPYFNFHIPKSISSVSPFLNFNYWKPLKDREAEADGSQKLNAVNSSIPLILLELERMEQPPKARFFSWDALICLAPLLSVLLSRIYFIYIIIISPSIAYVPFCFFNSFLNGYYTTIDRGMYFLLSVNSMININ